MDDLEFRMRAYAFPHDDDNEFATAIGGDPGKQGFLEDLRSFDQQLSEVILNINVPDDLMHRLRSLHVLNEEPGKEPQPDKEPQPGKQQPPLTEAEAQTPKQPSSRTERPEQGAATNARFRKMPRHLPLAASVILATGLGYSILFNNGPSASDLRLSEQVMAHVHSEGRALGSQEQVSFNRANQVMASTVGGQLRDRPEVRTLGINFVEDCTVISGSDTAHFVFSGEQGPVTVIILDHSPVSTEFEIEDSRFAGSIAPFGTGNLVILGEKGEQLDGYRQVVADNFQWSI